MRECRYPVLGPMSARRGFSLIEVMVALTLMSVVLVSVAKIGVALTTNGRLNDIATKRNAVLQLEANKFGAVPFASLAGWSTADRSLSQGGFDYTRRLSITKVSSQRYTVTITVIPTLDPSKKESVAFDRTLPSSGTPLCVGC